MNPLHPAHIGAVVRKQLINMGMGARLLWQLLTLMGPALRRPRLIGDQIHFLGNYSLAIIGVSGLLWALYWDCRATTSCSAMARPRPWA